MEILYDILMKDNSECMESKENIKLLDYTVCCLICISDLEISIMSKSKVHLLGKA